MATWTCQSCGRTREGEDGLTVTAVPGMRLGHCYKDGRKTVWRVTAPVNAGAKVGERRAQAGMGRAERSAIPEGWTARADQAIKELAASGERFTSDAVVGMVGVPETHHNAIGARINAMARAGVIRKAGFTKSSRETGHARTIAVWEGVS
jgi:hypothetical protein